MANGDEKLPTRRRVLRGRGTRDDRVTAAIALVALVAGVALLLADGSVIAQIVGAGLIGLAGVAFMALVFLLVGESEERDSEQRFEPGGTGTDEPRRTSARPR